MSLREVATQIGVSSNTVRRATSSSRRHRAFDGQTTSAGARAAQIPRRYPERARPRPWREFLSDALADQGDQRHRCPRSAPRPTRAELNAARRAARDAAIGQATILQVQPSNAAWACLTSPRQEPPQSSPWFVQSRKELPPSFSPSRPFFLPTPSRPALFGGRGVTLAA